MTFFFLLVSLSILFFVGCRALDGGVWMFVYPCYAVRCGLDACWCVKILEIVYEFYVTN